MTYLLSFLGIAAFWLACGFVAAGWRYAFYAVEWAGVEIEIISRMAWEWFWIGPVSLIVGLSLSRYRHGWRKWW